MQYVVYCLFSFTLISRLFRTVQKEAQVRRFHAVQKEAQVRRFRAVQKEPQVRR